MANLGNSCTELQKSAGEFYKEHFKQSPFGRNGHIEYRLGINIDAFASLIPGVRIYDGDLSIFQPPNTYPFLRKIEFYKGTLQYDASIQNYLPRLESLAFNYCKINVDIYDTFLEPTRRNLKRLYIRDSRHDSNFIGTSNKWTTETYPRLEHFEFFTKRVDERMYKHIYTFLENNPQILSFSTTIEYIDANRYTFQRQLTGRHFTVLSISHENTNLHVPTFMDAIHLLYYCKLFWNLFQNLRIYFSTNAERQYDYTSSRLLPYVKLMHYANADNQKVPVALDNVERLYIRNVTQFTDLTATMERLNNLQFIYFTKETIENIIPFIRWLSNLKEIKINEILEREDYYYNRTGILDLPMLNEERRKFPGKGKIHFYLHENNFVATRKKYKRKTFSLVEYSRIDSHEDPDYFGWH